MKLLDAMTVLFLKQNILLQKVISFLSKNYSTKASKALFLNSFDETNIFDDFYIFLWTKPFFSPCPISDCYFDYCP